MDFLNLCGAFLNLREEEHIVWKAILDGLSEIKFLIQRSHENETKIFNQFRISECVVFEKSSVFLVFF